MKLTYIDVLNRMGVLGDALQLNLPAKVKAETLLLRAHYSKGVKEWQSILEQIEKDSQVDGSEPTEEQAKIKNDAIEAKVKEEVSLADRRYSTEAFEALCGAVDGHETVVSVLTRNDEGVPQPFPSILWLEYVANNLVAE